MPLLPAVIAPMTDLHVNNDSSDAKNEPSSPSWCSPLKRLFLNAGSNCNHTLFFFFYLKTHHFLKMHSCFSVKNYFPLQVRCVCRLLHLTRQKKGGEGGKRRRSWASEALKKISTSTKSSTQLGRSSVCVCVCVCVCVLLRWQWHSRPLFSMVNHNRLNLA